ncbi:MAG: MT-A70 family methyltransferase, partial [Vampirovibrionales bacterium]
GYWFRGQHELLLVATKGKFSPPDQQHRVSSVFRESRTQHSKKPECVYQWIEAAFPEAHKLEMFCRTRREGWQVWGNEADA